ncbi:unnamed protein product [Staurois parvus]|uniref:Uncharacterized protein n=1 Tax=Staurois parvus TaxID=386267 RepID=A0ABN9EPE0_9NEOB|nr:unnamed protein product [Staurois parvus]
MSLTLGVSGKECPLHWWVSGRCPLHWGSVGRMSLTLGRVTDQVWNNEMTSTNLGLQMRKIWSPNIWRIMSQWVSLSS